MNIVINKYNNFFYGFIFDNLFQISCNFTFIIYLLNFFIHTKILYTYTIILLRMFKKNSELKESIIIRKR